MLNFFLQVLHSLFYCCSEKFLFMLTYNFNLFIIYVQLSDYIFTIGSGNVFCFCEYTLLGKFVLTLIFARLPGVI